MTHIVAGYFGYETCCVSWKSQSFSKQEENNTKSSLISTFLFINIGLLWSGTICKIKVAACEKLNPLLKCLPQCSLQKRLLWRHFYSALKIPLNVSPFCINLLTLLKICLLLSSKFNDKLKKLFLFVKNLFGSDPSVNTKFHFLQSWKVSMEWMGQWCTQNWLQKWHRSGPGINVGCVFFQQCLT